MKDSKVTVLMSVYNGEKYLREAIDSILNQTFRNFEFLIINDGSTDRTAEILESYNDPRIKIINNERNMGLTKSLNKGLKMARGEYIARMDADDISEPNRLKKQVEFLDMHPSIGVVGINSYIIDESGNILTKMERPTSHEKIIAKILGENQMVHGSLMMRKKLLETRGYYDEEFVLAQDYELLLRLSSITKLANLSEQLHRWRRDTSRGISTTKRKYQIAVRDKIRKVFLEKNYSLDKNYINLVLDNFLSNPKDPILYEYLTKILKDISFIPYFLIKLKIFLYSLKKKGIYPKNILWLIKKVIKPIRDKHKTAKHKLKNHPPSLIFLMNNACNARCIMCGLSYANNKNSCEITLENYKKMLNNLNMEKVTEITFSGGGEPLLCKDLIKIVRYTKRRYPEVKLYLYTNGTALSEKFAREFIKQKFCEIVISINASTAETHQKIMEISTFDRVVRNIRNLVLLRNNSQANTQIQLSFVALLLNIEDLPGLITLGSDLGVDEVSMQYCRFYSRKFKLDSNECDSTLDKKYSLFFHKDHSDEVLKETIHLAKLKKIKFLHEPLFSDSKFNKKSCIWPWTTILIGPRGEIYPCGGGEVMFYKSVRDHKLYFGNLLQEHISQFWNNEDFKRLRQSCDYRNKNKSITQCYSCNHTICWEGPNSEKSHFIDIDI